MLHIGANIMTQYMFNDRESDVIFYLTLHIGAWVKTLSNIYRGEHLMLQIGAGTFFEETL